MISCDPHRKGKDKIIKMKEYGFTIQDTLTGLNEYTNACRGNKFQGAMIKATEGLRVKAHAHALKGLRLEKVYIVFNWYEKNQRRDPDNICFAKKFILDGLQEINAITGDGWKNIAGFEDNFFVDGKNPRIEVIIKVIDDITSENK